MIAMYQVWFRPNGNTETRWQKYNDQLAGGYRLSRACELAERLERKFPENEMAILPIGFAPCSLATVTVLAEAEALYANLTGHTWARS